MTTEQHTGVPKADVLAAADYYRDLAFAYGDCINDRGGPEDLVDGAVHSIKAGMCREFADELYRLAGVYVPMSQRRPMPVPPPQTSSAWERLRRAWASLFVTRGRI